MLLTETCDPVFEQMNAMIDESFIAFGAELAQALRENPTKKPELKLSFEHNGVLFTVTPDAKTGFNIESGGNCAWSKRRIYTLIQSGSKLQTISNWDVSYLTYLALDCRKCLVYGPELRVPDQHGNRFVLA